MKSVFKSGPGMFSADSNKVDIAIPAGKINVHTITFETYQLDTSAAHDLSTSFTILAAKAEESPEQLRLLKQLRDHLVTNLGLN